jgi:hypothetical protein
VAALGKCLMFHLKYPEEMQQIYWDDGNLDGIDNTGKTREMVKAVGDEAVREAAIFLEACGAVIETHFQKVAKCKRSNSRGSVEKYWEISFNVYLAKIPGEARLWAGVNLVTIPKVEIVPWLWARGKTIGEEKVVNHLKDRVKGRSADLGWEAGNVALDRISIPQDSNGDDSPLIERIQRAFSTISKSDCEYLFKTL